MAKNYCIETARKALSQFKENEITDYASEVFAKARSYEDISGRPAIERAIDEINNEKLKSYFEDTMITNNNITKYETLAGKIKQGKANLQNICVRRHTNLKYNIESYQRDAKQKLYTAFFGDLTNEERSFLMDGKNSLDISRAIDGKPATLLGKRIAEKHENYINVRGINLVNSNAMKLEFMNTARHFMAIHDRSRILSGGKSLISRSKSSEKMGGVEINRARQLWKEFIKPLLNLEKTFLNAFSKEGEIDIKKVDEILDDIFDKITKDEGSILTRSSVANDREAVARKSRMFFQWKDQEAWNKYNEQYGNHTYYQSLMRDINAASNKIGMANLMGDSPVNNFIDLRDLQGKINPKSNRWIKTAEGFYKTVNGENNIAVSPTGSAIGSSLRSYTSMARLGLTMLQSIPDIANGVMFARRWGFGFWEPLLTHIHGLFNLLPSVERQHMAKLMKINVDSHMGYVGRYVDAVNFSELTQKASTLFYKVILLDAYDKGNKLSSMATMGKSLYRLSKRSYDQLPSGTKLQLEKYDIKPHEWEMLRKHNENNLFTEENVDRITESDLRNMHQQTSYEIPFHQYRDDLRMKLFTIFDVASENSVLSPGAFTQHWMSLGGKPGTIEGEAWRFFMQFKGYAITYIDRVLYQGFKDSVGAKSKIGFGLSLFALTLPMSVLSTWLFHLAQGKTMPDFEKMSVGQRISTSTNLLLPGVSMLSRVFDPKQQYGDMLVDMINGPSLRFLGNALGSVISLAEGDTKRSKKAFKKAAKYILPSSTLPFISPYLNEVFGDKPHLEPGQKQIYGA